MLDREVTTIIYLQDSINGAPPTLCVGANKYPLTEGTAVQWLKVLVDFIQDRGLKQRGDVSPCSWF